MRSGQLAAPLVPVSERPIGPSLGQQNITAGVRALLIGSAALFVFMIFYYHLFGVVASVVLLGNVVLLTALLSLMKASLSLPGIAGILLTVGMAVDANVIIYERIREELRNGVSPQAAIRAGFEKAWSAIWDSNVTTFIAGLVLWVIGTGPDPQLRHRAGAGHPHFDVHGHAGQPRAADTDLRRPAQAGQALDRLIQTGD